MLVLLALLRPPELKGHLRVSDDDVPPVLRELSKYFRRLVVKGFIEELNMGAFRVHIPIKNTGIYLEEVPKKGQGEANCWYPLILVVEVPVVHDEYLLVENIVGK
jgi:hypothetical protein